jgi:hypothetical protein
VQIEIVVTLSPEPAFGRTGNLKGAGATAQGSDHA